MNAPSTYRVFLSAVTKELGSYRTEIARVLRRKELEVREQEHFRQGPATLLEQLRAYIEHCDAVILLVGERGTPERRPSSRPAALAYMLTKCS